MSDEPCHTILSRYFGYKILNITNGIHFTKYSEQCCWRFMSSGVWHSDSEWAVPRVSKEFNAFMFKSQTVWESPEDSSSTPGCEDEGTTFFEMSGSAHTATRHPSSPEASVFNFLYMSSKSHNATMKGLRKQSQNTKDSWSPSSDWKLQTPEREAGVLTTWFWNLGPAHENWDLRMLVPTSKFSILQI